MTGQLTRPVEVPSVRTDLSVVGGSSEADHDRQSIMPTSIQRNRKALTLHGRLAPVDGRQRSRLEVEPPVSASKRGGERMIRLRDVRSQLGFHPARV